MSTISVDYDVLNQRGSPAWFTDTFANIPTAGYVGRMFISTDTFAFYRDTGTGWDLIGGPGIGTLTGSGVVGQVSFFNGTQVLAGNNNLFWDNTNSRLGINTTTPGQPLDIHSTGNTLVQLNNTTTANSNISFQNQNVAKWRVGNVYNAGANSFNIENATTSTTILSIGNSSNASTFSYIVNFNDLANFDKGIAYKDSVTISNILGGYVNTGFSISGSNNILTLISSVTTPLARTYTFPNTNGTFALTSDLSSYLPLAGGIMTGSILLNNNLAISGQLFSTSSYASMISMSPSNKVTIDNSGQGVNFGGTIGNGTYTYTLPGATGTLALGTGASGQVGYWSGTNTQSGSNNLYWDNTNNRLGINTTTPLSPLQVVIGAGSGTVARFGEASGTTGKQLLVGVDTATGRSELASIHQGTGATPLALNPTGGNVLVGTTTDSGYKLNVSGTGNFSSTLQGTSANFSGNLEVGSTGLNGKLGIRFGGSAKSGIDLRDDDDAANVTFQIYRKADGTGIGSITRPGLTNAVLYNTTSDYRLKEDYKQINGLEKLLLIKVYDFKWKGIEDRMDGVIAHELQQIIPYAVHGQKDAIEKNGNLLYQGVDYSKLVPILIKSIQELNDKLVRNNIN